MRAIWQNIPKNELRHQYSTLKKSVEKCSKHFGCSDIPIKRALKEYGIPVRTHQQAQQLRWSNPEHRKEMIRKLLAGQTHPPPSEETKRKISEAQIGKKSHWYGVRGKDNPNYKHGKSKRHRTIRCTAEYKQWQLAVFKRDWYACQRCGVHQKVLHAHHILPFIDFPEERFTLDNGCTLCPECHRYIHTEEMQNG